MRLGTGRAGALLLFLLQLNEPMTRPGSGTAARRMGTGARMPTGRLGTGRLGTAMRGAAGTAINTQVGKCSQAPLK